MIKWKKVMRKMARHGTVSQTIHKRKSVIPSPSPPFFPSITRTAQVHHSSTQVPPIDPIRNARESQKIQQASLPPKRARPEPPLAPDLLDGPRRQRLRAKPVLAPQQRAKSDVSVKGEQHADEGGVERDPIVRRVSRGEQQGGEETGEIAPAVDAEDDGAFARFLDVAGQPGDGQRARDEAAGQQDAEAGVAGAVGGLREGDGGGEAEQVDGEAVEDGEDAFVRLVAPPGEEPEREGTGDEGRGGEEVSADGVDAEAFDDEGKEDGEGHCWDAGADVDDEEVPDFPVAEGL